MKAAIDTNVLLDLLAGDPGAAAAARRALASAGNSGPLVICPVVYAELAVGFTQQADLTTFLRDLGLLLEGFTTDALGRAAAAWQAYLRRRGRQVECPRCGHHFGLPCPACRSPIAWRQHLIADFLIGGHAITDADLLITRDRGYYRTYFPRLALLVP